MPAHELMLVMYSIAGFPPGCDQRECGESEKKGTSCILEKCQGCLRASQRFYSQQDDPDGTMLLSWMHTVTWPKDETKLPAFTTDMPGPAP